MYRSVCLTWLHLYRKNNTLIICMLVQKDRGKYEKSKFI